MGLKNRRDLLQLGIAGSAALFSGCAGLSDIGGTSTPTQQELKTWGFGTDTVTLEEDVTYRLNGTNSTDLVGIYDLESGADLIRHNETTYNNNTFEVAEAGTYGVVVLALYGRFDSQAEGEIQEHVQLDDAEDVPVVEPGTPLEEDISSFIESTTIPSSCQSGPYGENCMQGYDSMDGGGFYERRLTEFMYHALKADTVDLAPEVRESIEEFRERLRRLKVVESTFHELEWGRLITDVIAGRVQEKALNGGAPSDFELDAEELQDELSYHHRRVSDPEQTGEFEYDIEAWYDAEVEFDYPSVTLDVLIAYELSLEIGPDTISNQTNIHYDDMHLAQEVTVIVR